MEPAAIQSISTDQCCAVVVTWQPDLAGLGTLLSQLLAQSCDVVVVDNGSDNAAQIGAQLQPLAPAVTFISWDKNMGLAKAMNAGIQHVRHKHYAYVMLFDQDSLISSDFVATMLAQWGRLQSSNSGEPDKLPPAAIGPRLQDPVTGRRTPFRCFRWLRRSDCPIEGLPGLFETDFLISSGTLISTAALQKVGLMKDEYFIDNIDLEWCFRAKAQGFSLYGTDRATLYHRIGEASPNPLVKSGIMVQHSPSRSYYSTRNRMHLWRQPYAPRDWKMRDIVRFLLKSVWLIGFTAKRKEYRQQIKRGMVDSEQLP